MISVIICTYNRSSSLRVTLKSLKQLVAPRQLSWELIIVNNNSDDDTREVVQSFVKASQLPIRYVFESTQGLCYARNAGIREARGELLAFTDDDVTVDQYWLYYIENAFNQFDCMGVGGRIVPVWTFEKPSWLEMAGTYRLMNVIVRFDPSEECCSIVAPPFGANMAFKKLAFEKYGFFRTDLDRSGSTLIGGGDTEFGRRLIKAGEKLFYMPSAIVYHPVERHRIKKRYFRLWYFNYGRSIIRESGIPENAVCYFGIPRFLFRGLIDEFPKWIFCRNSHRRFYHKLQTYLNMGSIIESLSISRKLN